jgi:hypothetical protein
MSVGIKLTTAGHLCVNPECGRELFVELDGDRTEACVECDPPREGLPTAFRLMAESRGVELEGKTPGEIVEALGFMSGHCSGRCRRGGDF